MGIIYYLLFIIYTFSRRWSQTMDLREYFFPKRCSLRTSPDFDFRCISYLRHNFYCPNSYIVICLLTIASTCKVASSQKQIFSRCHHGQCYVASFRQKVFTQVHLLSSLRGFYLVFVEQIMP